MEQGRKLEEQDFELVPERSCPVEEGFEQAGFRLKPRIVLDPTWRLESEGERIRCRRDPIREDLLAWDPVEALVDLDDRELIRVELQHLRSRKVRRIEGALPFLVVVPAGADKRYVLVHESVDDPEKDRAGASNPSGAAGVYPRATTAFRTISKNSSIPTAPRFSFERRRTDTAPASASRSPTTNM